VEKISKQKTLDIIKAAIEDKEIKVDFDSSSINIPSWDSLTQINIIVALDDALSGKVSEIDDLSTAASVAQIIVILEANGLIDN